MCNASRVGATAALACVWFASIIAAEAADIKPMPACAPDNVTVSFTFNGKIADDPVGKLQMYKAGTLK